MYMELLRFSLMSSKQTENLSEMVEYQEKNVTLLLYNILFAD